MEKYKAENLIVIPAAEGMDIVVTLQPSEEARPNYFVKHYSADEPAEVSYVEADPQPGVSLRTSVTITDAQARELANRLAHHLVTR